MSQTTALRRPDLTLRVALLGALSIVVALGLIAVFIVQSRQSALDRADENGRQLARSLEVAMSATFQSAEIILDFVAAKARAGTLDDPADGSGASNSFIQIAQGWPFIQSVGFVDPNGRMFTAVVRDKQGRLNWTNVGKDIDLSQRATVTSHRNVNPEDDKLYLSEVQAGYATDTPLIIISKGVWKPDKTFVGVATVSIRQDSLESILKISGKYSSAIIALFRTDGTLLYANPTADFVVGNDYSHTRLIETEVKQTSEGSYPAQLGTNGGSGRIAYRVAARYPFVIAVGFATYGLLAEWQRFANILIIVSLAIVLGIAVFTISLTRRITALRKAQEALRESETKLKDLLECSSDYQWEMDENGIVTYVGGPGIENFPNLVGRPGRDFFADVTEPSDLDELRRRSSLRLPVRGLRIATIAKDGEVRWVRNSSNPIFDSDGVYRGYRGVGTDITENLRQRDIIEAQRKTEALGRLASGLAHEINNLLQPILIYSGLGSAGDASDERAAHFSKIRRAAESASQIVKNVLAFTRRSPPRREQVNLAEVVRETCDVLDVRVPDGITISFDPNALQRNVLVDPTGLGQALTNLLTNAIESLSHQSHVDRKILISAEEIEISDGNDTSFELAGGMYCRLSVTDNGPGISMDRMKNVFDPFFTTKAQGQGTGLGLSIVAGLVKSWGGAVSVNSVLGERTEFSLYLPMAKPMAEVQAAQ